VIEVSLFNTFDRLTYPERVILKYAMIDWCTENIGENGSGWSFSNDLYQWRKFFFDNADDALAFKLAFSKND
jgi:hypothetical protein